MEISTDFELADRTTAGRSESAKSGLLPVANTRQPGPLPQYLGYQEMTDSDGAREERLAAIRQQIAEGTYETPDKLEAAVDRLLDRFLGPADDPTEATG